VSVCTGLVLRQPLGCIQGVLDPALVQRERMLSKRRVQPLVGA
jgi:hypothetical protein